MVPRDLFEKMAALALVAILLLGILSFRAFAVDVEDSPEILYKDSGPLPGDFGDVPPELTASLAADISAIRQDIDIFLYFVIPCSVAVLIVYLLCKWFCRTFVDSVL